MKRKQAVYLKRIQNNDSKDDQNLENKMETQINRSESQIEIIQKMFNKETLKKMKEYTTSNEKQTLRLKIHQKEHIAESLRHKNG